MPIDFFTFVEIEQVVTYGCKNRYCYMLPFTFKGQNVSAVLACFPFFPLSLFIAFICSYDSCFLNVIHFNRFTDADEILQRALALSLAEYESNTPHASLQGDVDDLISTCNTQIAVENTGLTVAPEHEE